MTGRLKPTGDAGLDAILRGGLPEGGLHLIQAPPGAGKTTLALQFLIEGARAGERGLYVTLSQTARELRAIAASHGWGLAGVEIVELQAGEGAIASEQTIFQTADLRLDRTREAIEEAVARVRPARLVYDSLLEVRLLTRDPPRYHRELIALRDALDAMGVTALLLDTAAGGEPEGDALALGVAQGVINMSKTLPAFGRARRRIEISKMRGVPVHDGWHDMAVRQGRGVVVFPRVVPASGARGTEPAAEPGTRERVPSGMERLDELSGGGLEPGTTTMVVGQAGTGKSTIAALYMAAVLGRGERVALFLFDERLGTFLRRCEALGMPMREHHASGRLTVHDYSPDEVSAGEFSQMVQAEAERDGLGMVAIDSLTGYMTSLADGAQALFDIQTLMKYLARREVLTIMVVAQQGLLGERIDSVRFDLSFLGDMVLLLRMHEDGSRIRRTIAPIKKRHGSHLRDVCDLVIAPGRVEVGEAHPGARPERWTPGVSGA